MLYGLDSNVDVDPALDVEPATILYVWFQTAVAHNCVCAMAIQSLDKEINYEKKLE
jgi:hypothetical protein